MEHRCEARLVTAAFRLYRQTSGRMPITQPGSGRDNKPTVRLYRLHGCLAASARHCLVAPQDHHIDRTMSAPSKSAPANQPRAGPGLGVNGECANALWRKPLTVHVNYGRLQLCDLDKWNLVGNPREVRYIKSTLGSLTIIGAEATASPGVLFFGFLGVEFCARVVNQPASQDNPVSGPKARPQNRRICSVSNGVSAMNCACYKISNLYAC